PGTFREHAEGFLDRTDGCLTLWSASVPHPYEPEVRVSGISGEMYRVGSYEAPFLDADPPTRAPSPEQAAAVIGANYRRGLRDDVLRPASSARLNEQLLDYFVHLEEVGTPRDQLVYRYFAGYHNRVVTGELLEL